jgi:hypothetical protein
MGQRHFQNNRGGVYVCKACGKRTRETGECESGVELCRDCYEDAGYENEHQDGYHDDEPNPSCPWCRQEGVER